MFDLLGTGTPDTCGSTSNSLRAYPTL